MPGVEYFDPMALAPRLRSGEGQGDAAGSSSRHVDSPFLFDGTRRSGMPQSFVEIIDDSELFERPSRSIDDLHFERNLFADMREEWTGDQHRDRILAGGRNRGCEKQTNQNEATAEAHAGEGTIVPAGREISPVRTRRASGSNE